MNKIVEFIMKTLKCDQKTAFGVYMEMSIDFSEASYKMIEREARRIITARRMAREVFGKVR